MLIILCLLSLLLAAFQLRSNLALENLALRQQLAIMGRRHPRPRVRRSDRVFWLILSRAWSHWRETLVIVQPETVIRWHRKGFTSYWTRLPWRSRPGWPRKDRSLRRDRTPDGRVDVAADGGSVRRGKGSFLVSAEGGYLAASKTSRMD